MMKEGFSRLSVDELAAGMGISKKTLYATFPTKQKIVEAVLDSFLTTVKGRLERIMAERIPFVDKFFHVMLFLGETSSRIGKPFLVDLQRQMPHLWEKVQRFRRDRILTQFAALLHEGVEDGSIRPQVREEVFLASYLAAVEAVINPTFLMNQSLSTREAMSNIVELFFLGAMTPQASRKVAARSKNQPVIYDREVPI